MSDNTNRIFILRAIDYSDSSIIYDAIVEKKGRASFMQRISKGKYKNLSLQFFNLYSITYSGKNDMKYIREYDLAYNYSLESNQKIYGMYINELVYYMTKKDLEYENLFEIYKNFFKSMSDKDDLIPTINKFEINLLEECGHFININFDEMQNKISKNSRYYFDFERGLVKSSAKNSFKGELFFALNGQIDYDDQLRRDSRIFMKFIIDHFIGSNKIRTREILKYLLK
ncbi:MAG: recombination protein O N-terminal domain-containing protein [Pseudomonadota bacterium]|nr:recombination protein O N-terminal domain-containing protein [Pseudomonadota bacterium]MEC9190445.1 recombination protein O N-terminal domain-containing protein [Pseudomonadota bacterium]